MVALNRIGVHKYLVFALDEDTVRWCQTHDVASFLIQMVDFRALWYVRHIVFLSLLQVLLAHAHPVPHPTQKPAATAKAYVVPRPLLRVAETVPPPRRRGGRVQVGGFSSEGNPPQGWGRVFRLVRVWDRGPVNWCR